MLRLVDLIQFTLLVSHDLRLTKGARWTEMVENCPNNLHRRC